MKERTSIKTLAREIVEGMKTLQQFKRQQERAIRIKRKQQAHEESQRSSRLKQSTE